MFRCEFSARFVLPRIRVALARELRARGFSVTEIAKMLETSPAAVSQYLSGKRGKDVPPQFKEDVRRLAERLAAGEDVSKELCDLCNRIRESGLVTN